MQILLIVTPFSVLHSAGLRRRYPGRRLPGELLSAVLGQLLKRAGSAKEIKPCLLHARDRLVRSSRDHVLLRSKMRTSTVERYGIHSQGQIPRRRVAGLQQVVRGCRQPTQAALQLDLEQLTSVGRGRVEGPGSLELQRTASGAALTARELARTLRSTRRAVVSPCPWSEANVPCTVRWDAALRHEHQGHGAHRGGQPVEVPGCLVATGARVDRIARLDCDARVRLRAAPRARADASQPMVASPTLRKERVAARTQGRGESGLDRARRFQTQHRAVSKI
jgi:hypothetical protein